MLREPYDIIYNYLLETLEQNEAAGWPEPVLVEKNFIACFDCWGKVKNHKKDFETDEEEIEFFRHIKPAFTKFIEYYRILNEALLFVPDHEDLQWPYWNNELGRYMRFRNRHQHFVQYYEDGLRENDALYFLTKHYKPSTEIQVNVYDTDESYCTMGDPLVCSLGALSIYQDYVSRKLRTMIHQHD